MEKKESENKEAIKVIVGLSILLLMGLIVGYQDIVFNIDIGGHMERAANANSIELATQEMDIVVHNMENRGMVNGYTSIIYKTPDEDVGYWYNNMKASLTELRSVNPNATPLEKSNILMKLRESLTTNDKIITPPGIVRFPYNTLFAIFNFVFLIIAIWGCMPSLLKALN